MRRIIERALARRHSRFPIKAFFLPLPSPPVFSPPQQQQNIHREACEHLIARLAGNALIDSCHEHPSSRQQCNRRCLCLRPPGLPQLRRAGEVPPASLARHLTARTTGSPPRVREALIGIKFIAHGAFGSTGGRKGRKRREESLESLERRRLRNVGALKVPRSTALDAGDDSRDWSEAETGGLKYSKTECM